MSQYKSHRSKYPSAIRVLIWKLHSSSLIRWSEVVRSFNDGKRNRTSWFKHVVVTPAVSTVLRMHRAGEEGAATLGRVIVQERRYLDGRYWSQHQDTWAGGGSGPQCGGVYRDAAQRVRSCQRLAHSQTSRSQDQGQVQKDPYVYLWCDQPLPRCTPRPATQKKFVPAAYILWRQSVATLPSLAVGAEWQAFMGGLTDLSPWTVDTEDEDTPLLRNAGTIIP